MSAKRIFLMLLCVICISSAALADTAVWADGGDPNNPTLWNTAANWSTGLVPGSADTARFNGSADFVEIVAGDNLEIGTMRICWGDTHNAHILVHEGGTLTCSNLIQLAYRVGGTAVLEIDGGTINGTSVATARDSDDVNGTILINSGSLNLTNNITMGVNSGYVNAKCSLIMNGGTVTAGGNLQSVNPGPIVLVDLNDGVLDVGGLDSGFVDNTNKLIDIDFGTWIIDGDVTANIDAMITAGKLLGWGGLSAVSYDYDVTNSGKTTVTAIHPLNPDPEHRAVVQVADGPVTLSWDNYVDPNGPGETVTADVWFGTDPNKLGGNYSKIVNAADVTGVARSSSAPQAIAADTTYYWQVDFDNGSGSIIEGPVFEFSAIDNDEPQVTVQNIVTYLVPENDANGIAVITEIFADVIDDTPGITYAWTIDPADPGIVFSDTTVVNPTITAYTNGVWTITLTVDDGYWVVPTSAQLRVSRNACAAARYTPGYVGDPIGDITSNCVVDLVDFANLAQSWMEDTNLGAPLYY